jgi:hypothetical protein
MRHRVWISGLALLAVAAGVGIYFAVRVHGYSAAIIGYRPGADARHVRVVYGQGRCDQLLSAKASENATKITVRVMVKAVSRGAGCADEVADNREVVVALREPLAARSLVNDHDQRIPSLP